MKKDAVPSLTEEEPLIDTTASIPLRSKRTDRKQKKQQKREKAYNERKALLDLPSDIVLGILSHLRPSDVFFLSRTSKAAGQFIRDNEATIATSILKARYPALAKCFQLSVLLEKVDESAHCDLQSEERQEMLTIHKNPYQHIQHADPTLICTCLTCVLVSSRLFGFVIALLFHAPYIFDEKYC